MNTRYNYKHIARCTLILFTLFFMAIYASASQSADTIVISPTPADTAAFRDYLRPCSLIKAAHIPTLIKIYRNLGKPKSPDNVLVLYGNFITSGSLPRHSTEPYFPIYNPVTDVGDIRGRIVATCETDNERFPNILRRKLRNTFNFYRQTHKDTRADKELLVRQLTAFDSLSQNKPLFYSTIYGKFGGNIKAYVDDLYKRSILTNRYRLNTFIFWPSAEKLERDPGVQLILGLALYELWLKRGGEAAAAETQDSTAVPSQTEPIPAK